MIIPAKERKLYVSLVILALVSYGLVNLFSDDEQHHAAVCRQG